jgi:hypothetical protein
MKRLEALAGEISSAGMPITHQRRGSAAREQPADQPATPWTDQPTQCRAFPLRPSRGLTGASRCDVGVSAWLTTQLSPGRLGPLVVLLLRKGFRRVFNAAVICALTICGAAMLPPALARADMHLGNYNLNIPDRNDFHTWIWSVSYCPGACVLVNAVAQPVARAFDYRGDAALVNGHYTLAVDVPDGLRCGNIYYGSTTATHDVYTWDATALEGTLNSAFDVGCDGGPGTLNYPFTLTRL